MYSFMLNSNILLLNLTLEYLNLKLSLLPILPTKGFYFYHLHCIFYYILAQVLWLVARIYQFFEAMTKFNSFVYLYKCLNISIECIILILYLYLNSIIVELRSVEIRFPLCDGNLLIVS